MIFKITIVVVDNQKKVFVPKIKLIDNIKSDNICDRDISLFNISTILFFLLFLRLFVKSVILFRLQKM